MKIILLFFLFSAFLMNIKTNAQTTQDYAQIWDKQHISKLPASQVRHKDLQNYLNQLKTLGIKVEEVGRSYDNREIYQAEWGKGATKVFMWSQMHGDEPTATSGLMDMLAFLQANRSKLKWVKEIEEKLTIRAVPMLNPDGQELFQRRNLQGIDINRDAVNLATPEGRLLKKLRDEWQPDIGFNLHNQNELTTVGNTPKQATISFLAVSGDPAGKSDEGHLRNRRICSQMINALSQIIPGHIARYDDEYNPRAFGDRISEWGTPVILIETGALHGKDEMFLIKLNFIANLVALKSLTDGSYAKIAPDTYDKLPFNGSGGINTYVFRRANIVNFKENATPFIADVGLNSARRRAGEPRPTSVQDIGDLSIVKGLEEFDASNYLLVPKTGLLKTGSSGEFLFYRKDKLDKIDFKAADLETRFPPDAVFSNGKWAKGANLFVK